MFLRIGLPTGSNSNNKGRDGHVQSILGKDVQIEKTVSVCLTGNKSYVLGLNLLQTQKQHGQKMMMMMMMIIIIIIISN